MSRKMDPYNLYSDPDPHTAVNRCRNFLLQYGYIPDVSCFVHITAPHVEKHTDGYEDDQKAQDVRPV